MFVVNATTKEITMYRGDTGEMVVTATGYTFGENDRALFTVKNGNGTEIIKRIYEMDENTFTVEFANQDTDYLPPGDYNYDIRYIVGPDYDDNGNIVDGDYVDTPGSPFVIHILNTVGQI